MQAQRGTLSYVFGRNLTPQAALVKLHTSVLALAVLWAAWAPANVRAQPLETNENFIEEVRRRDDLDVRG